MWLKILLVLIAIVVPSGGTFEVFCLQKSHLLPMFQGDTVPPLGLFVSSFRLRLFESNFCDEIGCVTDGIFL